MNSTIEQRIVEKLHRLNDRRLSEVLDFVEHLDNPALQRRRQQAIDDSLAMMRQLIAVPSTVELKVELNAMRLDTRGFVFDREAANER